MSIFLTPAELRELTETPQRRRQIAWLDRRGWAYELSRLGNPKVLRAYAEQRMGLAEAKKSTQTEPDFTHWGKAA